MQGSPGGSPSPSGSSRLWRVAAQRNVRNSWSKILAQKAAWASASSRGLSIASSLVNAHLSLRYMPAMNLGVLKDMDGIRDKARSKLSHQQEEYVCQLVSSYKDLRMHLFFQVDAACHMVNASKSMRTYVKGSVGSPIVEFSNEFGFDGDTGDGGGIAVFSGLSVSHFEMLGEELVEMFLLELKVKRLLVVAFHWIVYNEAMKTSHCNVVGWNDELYPGEFDNVKKINILSKLDSRTLPSRENGLEFNDQTRREVLQVYLTAWLAEVNVNNSRIEEIVTMVGEEMQVNLL